MNAFSYLQIKLYLSIASCCKPLILINSDSQGIGVTVVCGTPG
jgi:hypothetical protein